MYTLPKLDYSYDALEPHIDALTMELHHSKHHQAYIDKLNAAMDKHPELKEKPLEQLLSNLNSVPEDIRTAVRNHGGGHLNHSMFWKIMGPNGGGEPQGELVDALNKGFGNFAEFKKKLSEASTNHFGSGWGWLAVDSAGKLEVFSLPNQDSPLSQAKKPVMGIDVWEHSWYVKYLNKKADYVNAWWNVVNWKNVGENFKNAMNK